MTPRTKRRKPAENRPAGRRAPMRRELVSPLISDDPGIGEDVRRRLVATVGDRQAVLVELNLAHGADPEAGRDDFRAVFREAFGDGVGAPPDPIPIATHYMRCLLTPQEITQLIAVDAPTASATGTGDGLTEAQEDRRRTIYRIWPDYIVEAHLDRSVSTIKADAAFRTYGSTGADIVWAVIDSGVDATHPHFADGNLTDGSVARLHRDFTYLVSGAGIQPPADPDDPAPALIDNFGHGTHVAGIIAGSAPTDPAMMRIAANEPTAQGLPSWVQRTLDEGRKLAGVAPDTRIVSLKVLTDNGQTLSSAVIAALDYIRTANADGQHLRIHGVNISLGCEWLPEEYAAGQSPLCRELDLLVGSGVVAVVSAGNGGAGGTVHGASNDLYGMLSTITDPGNSAMAITVGSTHRYKPHTFGITFDSSKGPTVDGRAKPDLVAPGERITSAATGAMRAGIAPLAVDDPSKIGCYVEERGTSMAAAHVSGAIAAYLSARTEFIGQPLKVKEMFLANATTLDRHQFFQGSGLVDLMRVLSNS